MGKETEVILAVAEAHLLYFVDFKSLLEKALEEKDGRRNFVWELSPCYLNSEDFLKLWTF